MGESRWRPVLYVEAKRLSIVHNAGAKERWAQRNAHIAAEPERKHAIIVREPDKPNGPGFFGVAQRPGFLIFDSFGSGGASGDGLCRATFFRISSKCAGSSSQPSSRAALINSSLFWAFALAFHFRECIDAMDYHFTRVKGINYRNSWSFRENVARLHI